MKGKTMLRAMSSIVILSVFLMFAPGCSQRLVDFTVISTKNIDWSQAARFTRWRQRVSGTDYVHVIIFIPTGVPNIKEAVDRAIESVPGAVALIDGVVIQNSFWIPCIYGRNSFIVEGTPLVDPTFANNNGISAETEYAVIHCDKKGDVVKTQFVDKTEYETIRSKAGMIAAGL